MKELVLKNGQIALVDNDIFEQVSQFTWSLDYYGYVARWFREPRTDKSKRGKLKQIRLQNVVLPKRKGFCADHKFHNLLDNRRSQLRYATSRTNGRNRRKQISPTSSRFKGVCLCRRLKIRKWAAMIGGRKNGKQTHLGFFATEESAAAAYNRAAIRRFGRYACLNKI